jgi:hypothetical protein
VDHHRSPVSKHAEDEKPARARMLVTRDGPEMSTAPKGAVAAIEVVEVKAHGIVALRAAAAVGEGEHLWVIPERRAACEVYWRWRLQRDSARHHRESSRRAS